MAPPARGVEDHHHDRDRDRDCEGADVRAVGHREDECNKRRDLRDAGAGAGAQEHDRRDGPEQFVDAGSRSSAERVSGEPTRPESQHQVERDADDQAPGLD